MKTTMAMSYAVFCAAWFVQSACARVQDVQRERGGGVCAQPIRGWCPAEYRGLVIGSSTRDDMLRILGHPAQSEVLGEADDTAREVWHHYQSGGEIPGSLVVVEGRSRQITGVSLYPHDLSREDIVQKLGGGYVETRYDFDLCLGDEESAPLFESKDGSVVMLEYRLRGLAIAVDDSGRVREVFYLSRPYGAERSRCTGSGS